MTLALGEFHANHQGARDLVGLAAAIQATMTSAIDVSDLLRSALVTSVSALDRYVHRVVQDLMVEIAAARRPRTPAFDRYEVRLSAALRGLGGDLPEAWLAEDVRRQHGYLAFQNPDKIAAAVRLVWDQPLWPAVATDLAIDTKDLKRELQLVVDRRNQIAHESDRDPTPPHLRWPIYEADVQQAIALIESIVASIDGHLNVAAAPKPP